MTCSLQPAVTRPTSTTDASAPARWSRRSFLGSLSAVSAATLAGCSWSAAGDQDFGGGQSRGTPPGGRAGLTAGYVPSSPYTLTAEAELSEDYHLVQNLPIDPKSDTVVACSRSAAQVEAVVLQKGVVVHYYPDATQTGGWGSQALPDATGVTAMVAGISGPIDLGASVRSDPALRVFYVKSGDRENLQVSTISPPTKPGDAPAVTTTTVPWSSRAVELQLAVNHDQSLLVAAMEPRLDKTNGPRLHFWTDALDVNHVDGKPSAVSTGYLTGFPYLDLVNQFAEVGSAPAPRWSAVVAHPFAVGTTNGKQKSTATINKPNLMLFTPFDTFTPDAQSPAVPSIGAWAWPVTSGTKVVGTPVNWAVQADRPSGCPHGRPETLAVVHATPLGGRNTPTLVVRTLERDADASYSQHLWVVAHQPGAALFYPASDPDAAWSWTELQLPAVPAKDTPMSFTVGNRPLPDSEEVKAGDLVPASLLDVFVVTRDALNVVRQASSGTAYEDYTAPTYCPAITLQPDVALATSQSGPSDGNELLVVGSDGTLQTLLKDPTSGQWSDVPLQTPSSEIQQLSTYRTQISLTDGYGYPLAGVPLRVASASTVTALIEDRSVVLGPSETSLATDDVGQLVLAVVADGLSSPALTVTAEDGSSLTIWPSSGVNSYFQGAGTLKYLDSLSAATLKQARSSDGTSPLLPGADDAKQAGDAVTTMMLVAKQATSKPVGARRAAGRSHRDGALGSRAPGGKVLTSADLIKDIDAWKHDALHAIKKGAAKVKDVVFDAKTGICHLSAEFVGWADDVVTVVVTDIEQAAHVLHALLSKLGGYVLEAVKWLEAEVFGTIRDSFTLAAELKGFLRGPDGLITYLSRQVAAEGGAATAWLTAQQQKIRTDFDRWRSGIDHTSTMKSLAQDASSTGLRRRRPEGAAGGSSSNNHHRRWLWTYIRWQLAPLRWEKMSAGSASWSDFERLWKTFVRSLESHLGAQAVMGLVDFWKTVARHPKDVVDLGEKALLDAVAGLVDWLFETIETSLEVFLELAVIVIDSLDAMIFSNPVLTVPGLAALLKRLGIEEPSIGDLILAAVAFPAVVVYKVEHKGNGYPVLTSQVADGRLGVTEEALRACAGGVSLIWAEIDAVSAVITATRQEGGRFYSIADIVIPLVLSVLTTPGTEGEKPFAPPPFSDAPWNYIAWVLGMGDAVLAALELFVDLKTPSDELKEFRVDEILFWETVLGALEIIAACLGAHADGDDGFEYAEAVFDSLPLLASPLLVSKALEESEFVTAGVDAAVVAASGIVNGFLFVLGDG